jgi:hypothetical protein
MNKLANLKLVLNITDTSSDNLLNYLLSSAEQLAINKLYPFVDDTDEIVLSTKYDYWVVSCAKEMYQSLGSENVKSYSENGLSITYAEMSGGVSKELMNQLIPRVGVPK